MDEFQQRLWHDSIYDALGTTVSALGGPKKVGALLWPAKAMKDAQRLVLHCLDPERPEKFGPEEVELLMFEGRNAGCHALADYLGRKCLYDFKLTNPDARRQAVRDELAAVLPRVERALRELKDLDAAR